MMGNHLFITIAFQVTAAPWSEAVIKGVIIFFIQTFTSTLLNKRDEIVLQNEHQKEQFHCLVPIQTSNNFYYSINLDGQLLRSLK